MNFYLLELGYDVWNLDVTGYTTSKNSSIDAATKESSENNTKVVNSVLSFLSNSKKFKVEQCTSTKELWDKLKNIYSKESLLMAIEPKHVDQDKEQPKKETVSKKTWK